MTVRTQAEDELRLAAFLAGSVQDTERRDLILKIVEDEGMCELLAMAAEAIDAIDRVQSAPLAVRPLRPAVRNRLGARIYSLFRHDEGFRPGA